MSLRHSWGVCKGHETRARTRHHLAAFGVHHPETVQGADRSPAEQQLLINSLAAASSCCSPRFCRRGWGDTRPTKTVVRRCLPQTSGRHGQACADAHRHRRAKWTCGRPPAPSERTKRVFGQRRDPRSFPVQHKAAAPSPFSFSMIGSQRCGSPLKTQIRLAFLSLSCF